MNSLSDLFYHRIGLNVVPDWSEVGINTIIAQSQLTLPFDNLSVFNAPNTPLSEPIIFDKILTQQQGGLCYELNYLMNRVISENAVQVTLTTATIYDSVTQQWFTYPDTHVLNIVVYAKRHYLVDIGFGLKSPRMMVPLEGSIVRFDDLEYQITQDAIFYYFNFKHQSESQWSIGYRFAIQYQAVGLAVLEQSRQIITFSQESPFNSKPLIAIFTQDGTKVLSPSSCITTRAGVKTISRLTSQEFDVISHDMRLLDKVAES